MVNNYTIKSPKLLPNWMKNAGKLKDRSEEIEWCKNFFAPVAMGGPHYTHHVAFFDGTEVKEGHAKKTRGNDGT